MKLGSRGAVMCQVCLDAENLMTVYLDRRSVTPRHYTISDRWQTVEQGPTL